MVKMTSNNDKDYNKSMGLSAHHPLYYYFRQT